MRRVLAAALCLSLTAASAEAGRAVRAAPGGAALPGAFAVPQVPGAPSPLALGPLAPPLSASDLAVPPADAAATALPPAAPAVETLTFPVLALPAPAPTPAGARGEDRAERPLPERLAEEQRGWDALPAAAAPERLGRTFDLSPARLGHAEPGPAPAAPAGDRGAAARARRRVLRRLLGDGPPGWKPFTFRASQPWRWAPKAGLEGFLHEKLRIEARVGRAAMLPQLGEYFGYVDALLADADMGDDRAELSRVRDADAAPEDKDRALDAFLLGLAGRLRAELRAADPSLAVRDEAVYMVLARAYKKLEPGRTVFDALDDRELLRIRYQPESEAELDRIARMTSAQRAALTPVIDAVWLLDVFEIGELNRWGVAGGSPYSLRRYRVKAEHGGDDALRRFVERAHGLGLMVKADFIPNHYALDAELLGVHPEAFIHLVPPQPTAEEWEDEAKLEAYRKRILEQAPKDPWGWPMYHLAETAAYPAGEGRARRFILVHHPFEWGYKWGDMLQLDYSRPETRAWQAAETRRLLRDFKLDGLRRDMSYFVTNDRFYGHWFSVLGWERTTAREDWARKELARVVEEMDARRKARGEAEFLAEMDEAAREVNPAAVIIDEAYDHQTDISRTGSNAIYNKVGLYDALQSRDAEKVRAALWEAAFAAWQLGAAALVNFPANHDAYEGNPVDKFGPHLRAVLVNTLLLRPVLVYNGLELMVGRERMLIRDGTPSEDDGRPEQKMIPFDARAWIDWSQKDPALRAFLLAALAASARIRDLFRGGAMEVLEPVEGSRAITAWAVARRGADGAQRAFLAAANWSLEPQSARFRFGASGLGPLGTFAPRADRRYVLRDYAGGGEPAALPERSGTELAEGITVLLSGGGVHLFEIEEVVPAPGS